MRVVPEVEAEAENQKATQRSPNELNSENVWMTICNRTISSQWKCLLALVGMLIQPLRPIANMFEILCMSML